jgi:hypothetical protein
MAMILYTANPHSLFLVATHLVWRDNVNHCTHLGNWTSRYMGFNEFPGLPDRFAPPVPSSGSYDDYRYDLTPEQRACFHAHCFPDLEQMISCVREVRALLLPTTKLTRVYLLTNRRPEWLEKLKDTLQEDSTRKGLDEWEHIGTGRDLRLTRKQKQNSQAVDMAIVQRAEVFIGNGVRHLAFVCCCRSVMDSVVH